MLAPYQQSERKPDIDRFDPYLRLQRYFGTRFVVRAGMLVYLLQAASQMVLTASTMLLISLRAVLLFMYRRKEKAESYKITEFFKTEHPDTMSRGMIRIYGSLHIAFCETDQAERMAQHIFLGKYFLIQLNHTARSRTESTSFAPSSLTEIHRFDDMLRTTQRQNPSLKIILCMDQVGGDRAKGMFLIVCHLLMNNAFTEYQLSESFEHINQMLTLSESGTVVFQSCCMAVHRAKSLRWIDFKDVFEISPKDQNRIFIEEYIHYAW